MTHMFEWGTYFGSSGKNHPRKCDFSSTLDFTRVNTRVKSVFTTSWVPQGEYQGKISINPYHICPGKHPGYNQGKSVLLRNRKNTLVNAPDLPW